ncbi:hypothetical protein HanIR_Chr16g0803641 [Helianthus annuus]|nr:hypothetical protein HanIR_Chr16g0803641 [Helianthus annuus]
MKAERDREECSLCLLCVCCERSREEVFVEVNKRSSPCRLQTFGPPLLLQMPADVVRRLQTFSRRKNKQHLIDGITHFYKNRFSIFSAV